MKSAHSFRGVLLWLAACAPGTSPPASPAPTPERAFPATEVWTVSPGTALREGDAALATVPYVFMRLEVLRWDSLGLRVRCERCPVLAEGYVQVGEVTYGSMAPAVAAWGSLADFAAAVRAAAEQRDLDALRAVMAPDFSFAFLGEQTPDAAFAVWRSEEFRSLDEVPALLDRGLATRDGQIWSAPPEFAERLDYRGRRLGFRRRPDTRWEWIYLIRGIVY